LYNKDFGAKMGQFIIGKFEHIFYNLTTNFRIMGSDKTSNETSLRAIF